jgi:hypothetical protein
MPLGQLQVGPQFASPTSVLTERGDNYAALIVAETQGKYQEWARQGYVYAARSGAAAAIPVNTTCTNAPTLWNASAGNKICIPIKLTLTCANIGTQVEDGFTIMYEANMGTSAYTGGPFPTFTNIPPVSTRIGGGLGPCSTQFANAVVTWTTQPAALFDVGIGQWLSGAAATGSLYSQLSFDFDGTVVLNPGAAICLAAATAASSGTYWTSFIFAELPIVAGY